MRDPRPVHDKAFTASCVRDIVQYLQTHGFGRTVSEKALLHSPSTREFHEIFWFLIAQIDPFLESEGKLEEEVPKIMRALKYPVDVPKSKLQAVGAPNTWPQLIAVLHWLVKLLSYDRDILQPTAKCSVSMSVTTDGIDAHGEDPTFLRTLHENYRLYLDGNDDCSHEERMNQHFQDKVNALDEENRRIEEQNEHYRSRLGELKESQEYRLELQSKPQFYYQEADRERILLEKQEFQLQAAEKRKAELEKYDDELLGQSESLEVSEKELAEQVEGQACSKKDIERLKHDRQHLRSVLDQVSNEVNETEQGVWDLGAEESRLTESLRGLVRRVNETAQEASHALPQARVCELMVPNLCDEPDDALESLEFSCQRAHAEEAVGKEVEIAQAEEAAISSVLEEQRTVHEQLLQMERETRSMTRRRDELERKRLEHQCQNSEILEQARRTAEEAEDVVHAIPAAAAASIQDKADIERLERQILTMKQAFAKEEQEMEGQILRDAEKFADYKREVNQMLEDVLKDMIQVRTDMEAQLPKELEKRIRDGAHGGC